MIFHVFFCTASRVSSFHLSLFSWFWSQADSGAWVEKSWQQGQLVGHMCDVSINGPSWTIDDINATLFGEVDLPKSEAFVDCQSKAWVWPLQAKMNLPTEDMNKCNAIWSMCIHVVFPFCCDSVCENLSARHADKFLQYPFVVLAPRDLATDSMDDADVLGILWCTLWIDIED